MRSLLFTAVIFNGMLIFVIDKNYKYNRPVYWDKKHMQENKDTEMFDPKKTVLTQDKYYFHKEILIRWLDNDKKSVDLTIETNRLVGQELVTHAYQIRSEFKK